MVQLRIYKIILGILVYQKLDFVFDIIIENYRKHRQIINLHLLWQIYFENEYGVKNQNRNNG